MKVDGISENEKKKFDGNGSEDKKEE